MLSGLELKVVRIRRGLKQYEIAQKVGIHPRRLSEIETGRRVPSPAILKRLVEVLSEGDEENASAGRGGALGT